MRVQAAQVRSAVEALGLDPQNTGKVVIDWTEVHVELHAFDPAGRKVVQDSGRYAVAPVVLPIVPDAGASRGWRAA